MPQVDEAVEADTSPETKTGPPLGSETVLMSGYVDDAVLRRGLRGPDLPSIQKPFTPDALELKVREVPGS